MIKLQYFKKDDHSEMLFGPKGPNNPFYLTTTVVKMIKIFKTSRYGFHLFFILISDQY